MNIDEYRVGDELICVHKTTGYFNSEKGEPVLGKIVFGAKSNFNVSDKVIVIGWYLEDEHFGTVKKPKLFLMVAVRYGKKGQYGWDWNKFIVVEPKHWRLSMRYQDRTIDNQDAKLLPYG